MHIHLIGVCGTGMGSLAGLLKHQGHRVTGSDRAFHPPMGSALTRWGIECFEGFDPAHLAERPDWVVIGNVCRPDNTEARAAIDMGLRYSSLARAIHDLYLADRRPFVVAGTHGKTTTTAMLAFLLDRTGRSPGFLIGGIPSDFEESYRAGAPGGPFVIEGDEYDSAYFEKTPKFWQYAPQVALIHAIEHDHIDIYPDMAAYRAAFAHFVTLIPQTGLLLVPDDSEEVARIASGASCRVVRFGFGRDADVQVQPRGEQTDGQHFRLLQGGTVAGEGRLPMSGGHNLRNAAGALAMAHLGEGVGYEVLLKALSSFGGVARRQQLRGQAGGVRVYDDFAHHPTAVAQTLLGLRMRHPQGKLVAIFEPRSATASRRTHQTEYEAAFAAADETWIAPVGRPEIDETERLDVQAVAAGIRDHGGSAHAAEDVETIVDEVAAGAVAGDTVVVMSNGAFGGIHERLLTRLESA